MIDFNRLKSVDIEKLYIFNELCREGSIKKVLFKNDWTPRTIYYTLQVLEAAFDVSLYIKGKRNIILTDEGEKLYNLSMIFLESIKSIDSTKNEDYEGKLTIHSTVSFAFYYLTEVIEEFNKTYPNIFIKTLSGGEYFSAKYLNFDVMIGPNLINRSELTKIFLVTDEYNFFASHEYLSRHEVPKDVKDCYDQDIICYAGHHLIDPNFLQRNNVTYESNLYSTIVELCSKGYGIASVTRQSIHEYIKTNNLLILFDGYVSKVEDIYFCYKSYTNLNKPILDFYEIVKKTLKKYD